MSTLCSAYPSSRVVPRELGPIARLIAGTPPGSADRLKHLLNVDAVMANAGMHARTAYTQRIDAESKDIRA